MFRAITAAVLGGALFLSASPAFAASPIDGTWKAEVSSAKLSTKPDVWTIKDGIYDCTSCTPPYKIAADGKSHPVADHDYWDAASVTVVDPATLTFTRYRAGTEIGTAKLALSPDGNMLTYTSTSADNAKGTTITNTSMAKRVGPAPAGAHPASGSWQAVNDGAQISEENLIATMSMTGKVVKFALATGEHYEATIDGPQVPFVGDKAGAKVAVTAAGKGFIETDYVNGKAVGTYSYVPVDATTMSFKSVNLRANTTDEFVMKKQ